MHIFLQSLVSIQPLTSFVKFARYSRTDPPQVYVEMSADDFVDEVYYNGRSIRDTVSGVDQAVPTLKQFSFVPVPGAVLAIAANDNQPGNSASFYMRCTSTDSSSGWNFQIRLDLRW